MWDGLAEKPIRFTRHAVMRTLSLGFTEEDVVRAVTRGKRRREGKLKFRAILRSKKGLLVVTCSDYPDHILVITVGKGGGRREW